MKHTKLYHELGVMPYATAAEIKAAYRKRSKSAHPDAGGTDAMFASIKHAYDVLSDPERRARYDNSGDESGKPINSIESEAMSLLSQIMLGLLTKTTDEIDLMTMDVQALFVESLDKRKSKLEEDLQNHKLPQGRLREIAKRFKRNRDKTGPDILGSLIQGHLSQLQLHVEGIKRGISVVDCALNIMKEYTFEMDENQDPVARLRKGAIPTFIIFR